MRVTCEGDRQVFEVTICDFKADLLLRRLKPYSPPRLVLRGLQELLDRLENIGDLASLGFLFSLQVGHAAGQVLVGCEDFAQPHERPHDGDVDDHRSPAAQDAGEHRDALLGERIRWIAGVTVFLGTGHNL